MLALLAAGPGARRRGLGVHASRARRGRGRPRRSRLGRCSPRHADAGRRCRRRRARPARSGRPARRDPAAGDRHEVSSGWSWLLVAVGVLGLVAKVGNPLTWAADQVTSSGEVTNGPEHLGSLETNNRTVWWGEAWQVFRAHPAGGTGAQTFEIARKRFRSNAQNVSEPHSVPMQLLADTGLPGLALGLVVVVGLVLGMRAAIRRLDEGERAAAVALVALPACVRAPCPGRLRPRLSRRGRADGARLGSAARRGPAGRRRAHGVAGAGRRDPGRDRCGLGARLADARGPARRRVDPSSRRRRLLRCCDLCAPGSTSEPTLARAARRPGHDRGARR